MLKKAGVNQDYAQAAQYEAENVQFTPFSIGPDGNPIGAKIDWTNQTQALSNWRSAIQKDQDLRADVKSSLNQFVGSIAQSIHYLQIASYNNIQDLQNGNQAEREKIAGDIHALASPAPAASLVTDAQATKAAQINQDVQKVTQNEVAYLNDQAKAVLNFHNAGAVPRQVLAKNIHQWLLQ